ncbi:hypothetical protein LY28_01766 [Ruminiclostridium sufflavum DSM 19573]|uniref:Lipoprotein n=1 Tax=Ruminiclostridium sufflavum DSM 19573 TaxID=1121337 RepID=A0A318XK19_9FIRM|nr:hypothetical protein [Ruminiclostridium sufflavum]PYG87746.1 hypothetical protein LY28_01766 [Ruminiclostridium sufflavum DSM 19573]
MKKLFSLVLSLTLAIAVMAGCGSTGEQNDAANTSAGIETNTGTAGDAVKTGLAVVSSIANSADAGEKDGMAEIDSMVAAVTVDKDGKIVKCVIDAAQTKINFSAQGKILTDLKAEFKSKNELGDEYGMRKASKIGKEWNEQAKAFADYVVGKTAAEVKGIAVNEEGTAGDAELASSVTVHIGDFIAVTEKAVANAQDLGAKSGDKLGLGISTNIEKSTDAGEKDGLAQAYSMYTAATFDTDGKITGSIIDASQSDVNFNKSGKITSDIKAELKTKNELGDAYGMKKASKIGKEWYEEAAAFAKYVVGKTIEEVKGIAVNEEGVATEAELTGSVTVHIGDFQKVIEKANSSAK